MRRSKHRTNARAAAWVAALVGFGCASSRAPDDANAEVEALRERGRELFAGRALCLECHRRGPLGDKQRGPDLGEGERTAAYVAKSIVDPEADVFPGYARGVMKPPDQPPLRLTDDEIVALALYLSGEDDVDGARAALEPARVARAQRSEQRLVDNLMARARWSEADVARGEQLYLELRCWLCHDNKSNPETNAPCLHGIRKRLNRRQLARWIIAPPDTKMPAFGHVLEPKQVADLVVFIQETERPKVPPGHPDHPR